MRTSTFLLPTVLPVVAVVFCCGGCHCGLSASMQPAPVSANADCEVSLDTRPHAQTPHESEGGFAFPISDGIRMSFVSVPAPMEQHVVTLDVPALDVCLIDRIHITSFFVSSRQVTIGQWNAVMQEAERMEGPEEMPACGLSWQQCYDFCRRLSELSGQDIGLPTLRERLHAVPLNRPDSQPKAARPRVWFGCALVADAPFVGAGLTRLQGSCDAELEWCVAEASSVKAGEKLLDEDEPIFFPGPALYGQGVPALSTGAQSRAKQQLVPFTPADRVSNAGFRVVAGGDISRRRIVTRAASRRKADFLFLPSSLRGSQAVFQIPVNLTKSQPCVTLPTGVRVRLVSWEEEKGKATIALSTLTEPLSADVGEYVGSGKGLYLEKVTQDGVRLVVTGCEWVTAGSTAK